MIRKTKLLQLLMNQQSKKTNSRYLDEISRSKSLLIFQNTYLIKKIPFKLKLLREQVPDIYLSSSPIYPQHCMLSIFVQVKDFLKYVSS